MLRLHMIRDIDSINEGWIYPARDQRPDLETLRRHARESAAIEAAEARWAARALYRAQRRQALSAIVGGLLVMILVVATAV